MGAQHDRRGVRPMVVYGADGLTERGQAWALLALAAREHWALSPLPAVVREDRGKPRFARVPDRHFNLSHSGPLALCALDGAPVGVDVQVVKEWRAGLPARVCAPEELAWLESRADRWASFTALWALKESRVKYTGRGLTSPIRHITVPLPREGQTLLTRDGLRFRLYAGPGWRAAVCGRSEPPPSILWRDIPPKGGGPVDL